MADRLADLIAPIRAGLGLAEGWLVGGAIRDLLLGRPFDDWDVVVPGDARVVARSFARRSGGSPFALSERHGTWRVVEAGRTVDFTTLTGTLEILRSSCASCAAPCTTLCPTGVSIPGLLDFVAAHLSRLGPRPGP